MSVARARLLVLISGLVVTAAVVLGLAAVGGPEAGRRDRRDDARLADIAQIAGALVCHAEADAAPPAPETVAEISPGCLAPAALADPATGAAYRIERPAPDRVSVCATFEDAPSAAERGAGWPPFDPESGCVSTVLTAP